MTKKISASLLYDLAERESFMPLSKKIDSLSDHGFRRTETLHEDLEFQNDLSEKVILAGRVKPVKFPDSIKDIVDIKEKAETRYVIYETNDPSLNEEFKKFKLTPKL